MASRLIRSRRISYAQIGWSLAASLIFVPLAFWGVSPEELWHSLEQADGRPIAIAVGLFVLTAVAKTARWALFFPPGGARFSSLFAALIIGQLVNFLLPARLGEVARIAVVKRREHGRAAWLLGTIADEKIVELIALASLILIALPIVPLPVWLLDSSLRLVVLILGAVLTLCIAIQQRARLRRGWRWLVGIFSRRSTGALEQQFDMTFDALLLLGRRSVALKAVLWSALIWGLMIATNYTLFLALRLEPSWLVAIVLLIVLQIGVSVPSTPAKVGIFQYLTSLTLTLFGVSRETALSYGMLLYLIVLVPQVVIAGPFVWQEITRRQNAPVRLDAPSPVLPPDAPQSGRAAGEESRP
ncbi:MAG: flippase-like domain-containing protein [Chloroflexi bacterium]|nr:flippase-like domain-containing protein [Chloroflexota bacterium]MBI3734197.1 flippase-like domain-containing protein [Chloroflexota bacterium]